jgi:hypothetical protein
MSTVHESDWKRKAINAGVGVAAAASLYTFGVRRWHNRWGATEEEVALALPGDDIVERPNMNSTRAITINAPPEDIWPWLVQMGKGRGGLYSYDWLDIAFDYLDKPSAQRILPEFQQLKAGDLIPMGDDASTDDDFYVHAVSPEHALVIGANAPEYRQRVSWAMVLIPIALTKTRLIVRVRAYIELNAKGIVRYALLDPAAFIMLRKQMLNIKRLAESHPRRGRVSLA